MNTPIDKPLEHIATITSAPFCTLVFVAGFISYFLSLFSVDIPKLSIVRYPSPVWFALIPGAILMIIAIFIYLRQYPVTFKRINITKGQTFTYDHTKVSVQVGRIEATSCPPNNCAVLLPANTSFIDDCITDANSALGAYVQEKFPHQLNDLKSAIQQSLSTVQKSPAGNYPPGTTILLPSPFDRPSILLTASTIREEISGIKAFPTSVCESIAQAFKITSDKKITTLYMPLLGSGHGGMSINDSFNIITFCIKFWSKRYHHIKQIYILIDRKKANEINLNFASIASIKGGET